MAKQLEDVHTIDMFKEEANAKLASVVGIPESRMPRKTHFEWYERVMYRPFSKDVDTKK